MNEATRTIEVQAALADMREQIRVNAPGTATDAALYLLAALKRRGLRLITEDEWEDQHEQGEHEGRRMALELPEIGEGERLEHALLDPFTTR